MESTRSPVEALQDRLGADWPHINAAQTLAKQKREQLRCAIAKARIDSGDTSVVVFGSLARNEFTAGSDVDWTLLVDGCADPMHLESARKVEVVLEKMNAKQPGREQTFGTLAFSHQLVHQIGGQDDTNVNTTRRILLLLESRPVGRPEAYDRVIRTVLRRYVSEDRGFVTGTARHHVPRFLLNDFARYWWTMTVDFAYKQRTRFRQGSAIRNIKLRMSRKMIYVSGLLACFGCAIDLGGGRQLNSCQPAERAPECVECIRRALSRTPLEILSSALLRFEHLDDTANRLFGSYDKFLGILADQKQRERLQQIEEHEYDTDEVYKTARRASHEFRDGLLELFFDERSGLFDLTREYGVF